MTARYHREPPQVVIERIGRWTYVVGVEHGLIRWGPNGYGWFVLGRKRAKRKGRRIMRHYQRHLLQTADVTRLNFTVVGEQSAEEKTSP